MNLADVLRPVLVRAAARGLADDFTHDDVEALVGAAIADYQRHRHDIPDQRSRSGRLMVHLAALTAGLYRALEARDVEPVEARRLTAKVTAVVYDQMAGAATLISRIGSPDRRLERATRAFRTFPFRPPDYEMVDVASDPRVVAFDVVRCPVAEYFVSRGLGSLCKASWCDLDYPLARRWGGELVRMTTIAEGAERCDFRWYVGEAPGPEPPD